MGDFIIVLGETHENHQPHLTHSFASPPGCESREREKKIKKDNE